MKPLGEKSWTHFTIADKSHSSQSYPVLKSSPTTLIQTEKAKAIDPSFSRSLEGGNSLNNTPLRLVSPRPEPDSKLLTTVRAKHSQYQPGIVLSTPSEDENQTIVLHKSTEPPEALAITRRRSVSLQDQEQKEMAMRLRGSGTISPCSSTSLNDLIQSMPDTPIEDQSGTFRSALPVRLKAPRIEVSESSIDGSLDVQYAVSEVSNTASASLDLERVSRSLSKLAAISQEPSFDGPALEFDGTKSTDFQHAQDSCPPILEDSELSNDAMKLSSAQSTLKPPGVADEATHHSDEDSTLPFIATGNAPSGLPAKESTEKAALPGLPDAAILNAAVSTGIEAVPTPLPNKKKGRAKAKGARMLRRARRVVLRRPILCLVLGRQVAAPTSKLLKMASRGEPLDTSESVLDSVKAEPIPVPL